MLHYRPAPARYTELGISPRMTARVELYANGWPIQAIANELGLSRVAINNSLARLRQQLGVRNAVQMLRLLAGVAPA